jgi:uncharacterized protein YdeI (YjbR/CyaY-like superfamily)
VPMERIEIRSQSELRDWLKSNHLKTKSVWLVTYKKSVPQYYVSWSEIVDQLLCFGWIDSVIQKVDEHKTMRLISKRKEKSVWSQINKEKVEHLINGGLMTSSGLDAINRAKRDGSWDFLTEIDQLIIPKDLLIELRKYPASLKHFQNFPKSVRHQILYWIKSAKKPETRENRIIEVAFLASENIRAR